MLAMAVAHASPTLYERIGGEAKFKAIAEEFTNAILADDRINFTFADSDVKKFTQHIFEQLCNVTGGPCKYTGRDMHEAHAKLAINEAQFNAIVEDLYIAFDKGARAISAAEQGDGHARADAEGCCETRFRRARHNSGPHAMTPRAVPTRRRRLRRNVAEKNHAFWRRKLKPLAHARPMPRS